MKVIDGNQNWVEPRSGGSMDCWDRHHYGQAGALLIPSVARSRQLVARNRKSVIGNRKMAVRSRKALIRKRKLVVHNRKAVIRNRK